ncbi:MAG: hypothetical protein U1E55_10245 [Paracoccus sp. (in: a-proteobacteria)]
MKSAAIRLDSFSTQLTASDSSRALSNDLDAAFHRGYEQGLNEGRENSLDALTAALTDLQRHVSTSNEGMATARREVIAGIAPVLSAMIDILAAHSHKDRLCGLDVGAEADGRNCTAAQITDQVQFRCCDRILNSV